MSFANECAFFRYNLSDCPKWYKDLHDSLFFDGQATIPDEAT